MAFRSAFISKDYRCITWPEWFVEKYADSVLFRNGNTGAIVSSIETTYELKWKHLAEDIQKSIDWDTFSQTFILVVLHKCGDITRCGITRDAIEWAEPVIWKVTESITHNGCWECVEKSLERG